MKLQKFTQFTNLLLSLRRFRLNCILYGLRVGLQLYACTHKLGGKATMCCSAELHDISWQMEKKNGGYNLFRSFCSDSLWELLLWPKCMFICAADCSPDSSSTFAYFVYSTSPIHFSFAQLSEWCGVVNNVSYKSSTFIRNQKNKKHSIRVPQRQIKWRENLRAPRHQWDIKRGFVRKKRKH